MDQVKIGDRVEVIKSTKWFHKGDVGIVVNTNLSNKRNPLNLTHRIHFDQGIGIEPLCLWEDPDNLKIIGPKLLTHEQVFGLWFYAEVWCKVVRYNPEDKMYDLRLTSYLLTDIANSWFTLEELSELPYAQTPPPS